MATSCTSRFFTILCILVIVISSTETKRCVKRQAYVTYAKDDMHALGAMVLGESLTRTKTTRCLVAMVTNMLNFLIRDSLKMIYHDVIEVPEINVRTPPDEESFDPWDFLTINVWSLDMYETVVFLNSDTLPQPRTYRELLDAALMEGSFDDTVQGLLNIYFVDWGNLPFKYNVPATAIEEYRAAYDRFGHGIKACHFDGEKPWYAAFNLETMAVEGFMHQIGFIEIPHPFYKKWWKVFIKRVKPKLESLLREYNMSLVTEGTQLYLGDYRTGLHVMSGFYSKGRQSYPKYLTVRGRKIDNQFCELIDVFTFNEHI